MSGSMIPEARRVDPNNEASLTRFLDGVAAGFVNTALSRAFICEIDDTPPPYPSATINFPRLRQHLTPGITNGAHAGAELVEAGDFSALAVWETTTYRGVPFSDTLTDVGPIRQEWRNRIKALKEKHIGTITKEDGTKELNPFYHLGFLARNPLQKDNVRGAISAVVNPWLKRAEEEGVPIWLEATYSHAVDIYQHYGFRLVDVIRVGVGKRNTLGWPEEGGEGVCAYGMIYDPHLNS